jgi:hypothetical protein
MTDHEATEQGVTLTVPYKLSVLIVPLITFAALGASICLANIPDPPDAVEKALAATITAWQTGFGALVGFISDPVLQRV